MNGSLVRNLLEGGPDSSHEEIFETLLTFRGRVRIERILSRGECSPAGFWYDQPQSEWVIVLRGSPQIRLEGEEGVRALKPGDSLLLLPHVRHRVEWTDPESLTIWLAVHFDSE